MSPILTSQAGLHLSPILTSQAGPPMSPILTSQAGPGLSRILTSPATLMRPPRSATLIQWGTDTLRAVWEMSMAATINDVTRLLSCQQTDFCYLNLGTKFCYGFHISMAFGNKYLQSSSTAHTILICHWLRGWRREILFQAGIVISVLATLSKRLCLIKSPDLQILDLCSGQ
jgi:hypothetical protein